MRLGYFLLIGPLVACGGKEPTPPGVQPDAGSPADGGQSGPPLRFAVEVIDGINSTAVLGDNAVLSLRQEQPAVAYGAILAESARREVRYAVRGDDGVWAVQTVADPGANAPAGGDLVGLGLAHLGATPHITFLGGDDDGVATSPFPTDLILATQNGAAWPQRTLADMSGDAPGNCPNTQNTCNVGNVVGSHSVIRASGNNFAVAYRDTHFGFAVDDFRLSDLELYTEGGPAPRIVVDPVSGAGALTDLAWIDNNLGIAYFLETYTPADTRGGIWYAHVADANPTPIRATTARTSHRLSLVIGPGDQRSIFYFDVDEADLAWARSADGGATWAVEKVDQGGKTGLYPSARLDPQGRLVVAYTYCGPASDRDCPGELGSQAEVRVARQENGAWKLHKVDDGQGFGGVGSFVSLQLLSDGRMAIAYGDTRNNDLLFALEEP